MRLTDNCAPFATVLGVTDGGVEVFSCDYETADKTLFPDRDSYKATFNGVFTGYKYQCVELARRYAAPSAAHRQQGRRSGKRRLGTG